MRERLDLTTDPGRGDHVVVAPDRASAGVDGDDLRRQVGAGGAAVAQCAVRRIGPATGEHLTEHRVRRARGGEPRAVLGVDVRLAGRQEPRPDPRRVRAEGRHRGHPAGVGDPAGGEDRHVHRVDHRGHQGQRGDRPQDVPARLPPLRDDGVDAGRGGPDGVLDRPDHVHVDHPAAAQRRRDRRGVSPRGRQHGDPLGDADPHVVGGRLGQHEVDPERPVRQLTYSCDRPHQLRGGQPGPGQHTQAARLAHRRHQLRCAGTPDRGLHDRRSQAQTLHERRAAHRGDRPRPRGPRPAGRRARWSGHAAERRQLVRAGLIAETAPLLPLRRSASGRRATVTNPVI
ncbi:Basic proline-rich protein precursor [Pseudonocardia sp. Ae406_Ps2]|nr:Basic proline-rich protein precursor [Pseudonocardia sp. Ae406_Ps2]OLM07671.1 Basic proline-rich protein precursor [Pseudonocardia sp. Ae331_Ps2]OLM22110.1 Basic proline-rich protein precursor [Pseudonocardia sp. Ae706_Ps2]